MLKKPYSTMLKHINQVPRLVSYTKKWVYTVQVTNLLALCLKPLHMQHGTKRVPLLFRFAAIKHLKADKCYYTPHCSFVLVYKKYYIFNNEAVVLFLFNKRSGEEQFFLFRKREAKKYVFFSAPTSMYLMMIIHTYIISSVECIGQFIIKKTADNTIYK